MKLKTFPIFIDLRMQIYSLYLCLFTSIHMHMQSLFWKINGCSYLPTKRGCLSIIVLFAAEANEQICCKFINWLIIFKFLINFCLQLDAKVIDLYFKSILHFINFLSIKEISLAKLNKTDIIQIVFFRIATKCTSQ